jgi:small subunit ribosomal protein S6
MSKRTYEAVVIFDSSLPDEKIKKECGEVEDFIKSIGELEKTQEMGRKNLAYPIKRKKTGVYYLYVFKGEGDATAKLNKYLKIKDNILRFLIVVANPKVSNKPISEVAYKSIPKEQVEYEQLKEEGE